MKDRRPDPGCRRGSRVMPLVRAIDGEQVGRSARDADEVRSPVDGDLPVRIRQPGRDRLGVDGAARPGRDRGDDLVDRRCPDIDALLAAAYRTGAPRWTSINAPAYSSPASIIDFSRARSRRNARRKSAATNGPNGRCQARNSTSHRQSTRVPPSTGANVQDDVNGTAASMLRTATRRSGSSSVTSISFSVTPPPGRRTVARRREPTRTGPGVVMCSSIALEDQRGVSPGVVSTW